LSFVSVLVVIVAAFPLTARLRWRPRDDGVAAAALLAIVAYSGSPWMHEIRYAWISPDELEAALPATVRLNLGGFEYHPRVAGVAPKDLVAHLSQLSPSPDASTWSTDAYAVERIDTPELEKGSRAYRVRANRASTLVLPLAYARHIRATHRAEGNDFALPTYRTDSDPRIHIDVPQGETQIELRFPTVWRLLGGA
jgi:hypothetical protein